MCCHLLKSHSLCVFADLTRNRIALSSASHLPISLFTLSVYINKHPSFLHGYEYEHMRVWINGCHNYIPLESSYHAFVSHYSQYQEEEPRREGIHTPFMR